MARRWLSHASHLMLLNMADAIFPNIQDISMQIFCRILNFSKQRKVAADVILCKEGLTDFQRIRKRKYLCSSTCLHTVCVLSGVKSLSRVFSSICFDPCPIDSRGVTLKQVPFVSRGWPGKKSGLMKEISPLNLICNFGGEKVKGGDDVFHAGIAMSIMLYIGQCQLVQN